MVVRKKYLVQKSFRIDKRLESDTYLLSELTNRSQNDLVNMAIDGFLQDNAEWILQNAIVEQFETVIDKTYEEYNKIFKMGGVEVVLDEEDLFYKIHVSVKRGNKSIDDEYEKLISVSNDGAEEELKEYLRYIASYIDPKADDSIEYMKTRVDYSDYIPSKRNLSKRKIEKN